MNYNLINQEKPEEYSYNLKSKSEESYWFLVSGFWFLVVVEKFKSELESTRLTVNDELATSN
jgi:hypothetical protein